MTFKLILFLLVFLGLLLLCFAVHVQQYLVSFILKFSLPLSLHILIMTLHLLLVLFYLGQVLIIRVLLERIGVGVAALDHEVFVLRPVAWLLLQFALLLVFVDHLVLVDEGRWLLGLGLSYI